MAYLLDADVLIRAKNLHYRFQVCPGFWEWLVLMHRIGRVRSVERVRDELRRRKDDLTKWTRDIGDSFFVAPAEDDVASLRKVSDHVRDHYLDPAIVTEFTKKADYYLVGQALAGEHVVVTHEIHEPKSGRVKIPDVCDALGVECINPFEMLKREGASFVLEPKARARLKAAPPAGPKLLFPDSASQPPKT